jgi:hypothetical protein
MAITLLEKALPHFRRLIQVVSDWTHGLKVSANAQHLLAASLHASILEQTRAIEILLQNGNGTGAFIVLRSLLEAAVDLFNLVSDPMYAEYMHSALLNQQQRVLESASKSGESNPYLFEFVEHSSDVRAALTRVQTKLGELKTRDIKPLEIRKRFDRAGRLDLYEGPYAYLCWHSHNNINILEDRHLQQTPSGFAITYLRPPDDGDVITIVDTTAGMITNSTSFLSQLLESPRSQIDPVIHALDKLRALWKEEQ